jgi:hypothetical protein
MSIPDELLVDLCWRQLEFWLQEFQVDTRICRLSELNVTGKKSDLVLEIAKSLSASEYLSGALGKDYLVEADFHASGIKVSYQSFVHPVYPQLWGKFEPYMGIIDYWMNCGPGKLDFNKWRCV